MSHRHERHEKICLNCQSPTVGRFCHVCGQENVEPKDSFLSLVRHFIEDLTHFDGKFFTTIQLLFTRPGFLSMEYLKGRRATYLNPVRFYIFVSAFFFLLLMSVFIPMRHSSSAKKESSALGKALVDLGTRIKKANTWEASDGPDYKTLAEYDSLQRSLPEEERDDAVNQYFARKTMTGIEYSKTHKKEAQEKWKEKFFHALPYALFISLPFVALFLQLLYRRHKKYYYVSHVIFMMHMYCFVFLVLLLSMTAKQFGTPGYFIANLLRVSIFVYIFMAIRRFYGQSFLKTTAKFILFSFTALIIVGLSALVVALSTFLTLAS